MALLLTVTIVFLFTIGCVFQVNLSIRLLKWIRNKDKALRYRVRAAKSWLKECVQNNPDLFADWRFGARP